MNLGRESERVEFKRSTGEHREAMESIAAILNKHGKGTLYFGVANDGEVVGQEVSDTTLRSISQEIASKIEPAIIPHIQGLVSDDGKSYVRVDFEGSSAPYACGGRYRIRRADEDVLMSPELVGRMFVEASDRTDPWDGKPSGRPVEDANEKLLRRFVEHGVEKNRIPEAYRGFESCEDMLEHLGLARDGVLTNAAEVLFCEGRNWFRLSMGVLAGNNRVNILDLQHEMGPVLELIEKAEYYVTSNIRRRIVIDGSPMREEIPEIPREAIREAIINAFCHKKYRGDSRVMIDIFTDTVEIMNPGLFPAGTTPEDYLDGNQKASGSRNPNLAQALFRGGYIEAFGSGVRRIKEACDAAGVKVEYRQYNDETTVVFHRPGSQVEYVAAGSRASTIGRENRTRESDKVEAMRQAIIDCLTSSQTPLGRAAISQCVHLSPSRTSDYLRQLVQDGTLVASGGSRWRVYRLANNPETAASAAAEPVAPIEDSADESDLER